MFEFFTEVIKHCGIAGFIGIVIIGIIYFLIQKSDKKQEKSFEEMTSHLSASIAEQNKTLIESISKNNNTMQSDIVRLLDKSLEKLLYYRDNEQISIHNQSMRHRLDISEKMQLILFEIMNFYQARRCGVMEFHNNTNNFNGLSFLWYDLSYENMQRNVKPISGECKNQQLSMLGPVMSDIISNDGIVIYRESDIDKLEQRSPVLYNNLKHKIDVSTIVFAGLYDLHNNIIGVLFLEYDGEVYPYSDAIMDIHDVKERASAVSQLLDFKSVIE